MGGYQLPFGLPEGAKVKIVGRNVGYDDVEFEKQPFTVSMACVESGWEFRVNGKWRDEHDPLLQPENSRQCRRAFLI